MTQAQLGALWDQRHAELERAEKEHRRVQNEVNRMILESPVGIPLSDGQYRRIRAGTEARAAFERYQKAVEGFRAFVDSGTIPDESA